MLIVIDTRFLCAVDMPAYSVFTSNVFLHLPVLQSNHRFIFLVDKDPVTLLELPPNVSIITITLKPKNFLSYKWWYNVKLALALRKYKPDVFIGSYGLCSTTTNVPQLLILHDLGFLHKHAAHSRHSFLMYKKSTKFCLHKAFAIASVSQAVKEETETKFAISPNKIKVCGSAGLSVKQIADWTVKEHTKEQYSQGCEYFIFHVTDNSASQFLSVLKAFSIFKKWQRSNMKLVVIGHSFSMIKQEIQKLETYKFRSEIMLHENLQPAEMELISASAYSAIYPVLYEGFCPVLVDYMNSGVPAIVYDTPIAREMCGEAALYAPQTDTLQMAEQMKVIYKDEKLRSQLIEKGFAKAKEYSWAKTADKIWEMVESMQPK